MRRKAAVGQLLEYGRVVAWERHVMTVLLLLIGAGLLQGLVR
jgi:hypothetical protein